MHIHVTFPENDSVSRIRPKPKIYTIEDRVCKTVIEAVVLSPLPGPMCKLIGLEHPKCLRRGKVLT